MHRLTSVAIIGGGFSGICTTIHLIVNASRPMVIYVIEKEPELCTGVAYGTRSPYHPLNVKAGRMGAFAEQPGHFYSWLESREEIWRNFDPAFQSLKISSDSYLPRKLYAAYLRDLFYQAQIIAQQKGIICTILHDEAQDADLMSDGLIEVTLAKKSLLLVDYLVLATGIPSNQTFLFETHPVLENYHYISNIWKPYAERCLCNLCADNQGKNKNIIIIGSGLTAIDALFTLQSMDYQGTLQIISKHGTFPEVHSENHLPSISNFKVDNLPKRMSTLIRLFKSQLESFSKTYLNWRQVMDAFRHCTQPLWRSFSLSEKKQFMRHLFFLWNKHRHRMSPQSSELVNFYHKNRTLTLTAGSVQQLISLPNGKLQVRYYAKETGLSELKEADYVINCSGPDYKIVNYPNFFIQNLLRKKIIEPDDMGLGLKLIEKEILAGKGEGKIYAIGALLFGELFETTAVPELREQAHSIADTILSKICAQSKLQQT